MDTTHSEARSEPMRSSTSGRSTKIALAIAAFIGGLYLLREHLSHVPGDWFYVLLLAWPLMHLFHGNAGRHGRRSNKKG